MGELAPTPEQEQKPGFFSRINDKRHEIGLTLGLFGLFSLFGTRVTKQPEEKTNIPEQSLKIQGGPAMPEHLMIEKLHLDSDHEKISAMQEGYLEITQSLQEITNGEKFDGKYKDQLLTIEATSEDLGNDYAKAISEILAKTGSLSGTERYQAFKDGLTYLIDYYTINAKEMTAEEKQQFSDESALALSSYINEFMAQRKAGEIDHSVQTGTEVGLVNDTKKVIEAMKSSEDTATITAENIRLFIDSKITDMGEGAAYIQAVGEETMQLPLSEANNVQISNLYDMAEADPSKYKEVMDNILEYNKDYIHEQYQKTTGTQIGREELIEKINSNLASGKAIEANKLLPNTEIIDFDFDVEKLWNIIPIPVIKANWGSKSEKIAMNYEAQVYGGRVNETILCEGNHVQLSSLKESGQEIKPGRTELAIPALFFLIPLLAIRRRREEEQTEVTPSESAIDTSEPPKGTDLRDETVLPSEESFIVPPVFGKSEVLPTTDYPPKAKEFSTISEGEVAVIKAVEGLNNPKVVVEDNHIMISGEIPQEEATKTAVVPEKPRYVFALIEVDPTSGEIKIVKTGEADSVGEKEKSEYYVKSIGGSEDTVETPPA